VPYYIYRQKNTVGNFENVGYCLEGAEGLYNIYMMEEIHSVFAAGAGAVTKLVNEDRTHIKRIAMPKYPYEYLNPEYYDRVVNEREAAIKELVSE
jgi:oxygen-independent coproporphyrinogen-3 oxidase